MSENSKLYDLADRVDRNIPRHADPEAFHAEKSAIARELRDMAISSVSERRV